jgi:hypothetical protein
VGQGGTEGYRQAIPLDDVRSVSVWKRDRTANTVLWVIRRNLRRAVQSSTFIAAPSGWHRRHMTAWEVLHRGAGPVDFTALGECRLRRGEPRKWAPGRVSS